MIRVVPPNKPALIGCQGSRTPVAGSGFFGPAARSERPVRAPGLQGGN